MVGSKKFAIATLAMASISALALVAWTMIATPDEFDFTNPLELMQDLSRLLAPIAIVSVMFSLLVQWATFRGSSETLSKQGALHEAQAGLVSKATEAYAEQFETMSTHLETLKLQSEAAGKQAAAIQEQSDLTTNLIKALANAAADQRAQNLILVEGVEIEKARSREQHFVDALVANALRCSVQRSGENKGRGALELVEDRQALLNAKAWGTFSVTTHIFTALENFQGELTKTHEGKRFEDRWIYSTAMSCQDMLEHLSKDVNYFAKYPADPTADDLNERGSELLLGGLLTKIRDVRQELNKISRHGQTKTSGS